MMKRFIIHRMVPIFYLIVQTCLERRVIKVSRASRQLRREILNCQSKKPIFSLEIKKMTLIILFRTLLTMLLWSKDQKRTKLLQETQTIRMTLKEMSYLQKIRNMEVSLQGTSMNPTNLLLRNWWRALRKPSEPTKLWPKTLPTWRLKAKRPLLKRAKKSTISMAKQAKLWNMTKRL